LSRPAKLAADGKTTPGSPLTIAVTIAKHTNLHGVHDAVIEHVKIKPTGQPAENTVTSTN
jgi:hypothetical protein